MNCGLKKLIDNLAESGGIDRFPILQQHYPNAHHQDLLMRKNAYPYSWVSGPHKFNAERLPPKEDFFNDLNKEAISDAEYEHSLLIWETFSMKTFKDYHTLYLELDVITLADVLVNFRKTMISTYDLDPFHFISLPGYAWESMLKFTDIKLEVLSDVDQYLFLEKGIVGGISMACQRHVVANVPGTPCYDKSRPIKTLAQFDVNSLYPQAMGASLPTSEYVFISDEDIKNLDVMEIPDNGDYGYILSCAINIPTHLHDMFNDLPPLPEKIIVKDEWLSSYSRDLKDKFQIKPNKIPKVVPNLYNKDSITLHYVHLKLCIRLGLKLEKIHRVLRFRQSPWLKKIMTFNMEARKNASNPFEAMMVKTMSNSIYGKCLQSPRGKKDVRLVSNKQKLEKLIRKPNMKSFEIFDENLALVELQRTEALFNNPLPCAFAILDISKAIMYNTYYEKLMKAYGSQHLRLFYIDTDSLLVSIEGVNLFEEMEKHSDWFDTSNFEKDHPMFSVKNKGQYGLLKSETGSRLIQEYVGLRAKMYSLLCSDHTEKTVCKGIQKSVINKELKHSLYKQCLFSDSLFRHEMHQIKSRKHRLYTLHLNKISLCPFDDKRYILPKQYHETLAFGHWKIKMNKSELPT
jgi:hypothetical protein